MWCPRVIQFSGLLGQKKWKKNLPRKFDQFSSKFSPEKINKNFQDFGIRIYLKSTVPCCILIYSKKKTDLVFFQNMKLEIFFSEIFWLPKILRNPKIQWDSINFLHFEIFQKEDYFKSECICDLRIFKLNINMNPQIWDTVRTY